MLLLKLTRALPAENIALDEALLDEAEETADAVEILRLWEPITPIVVAGSSSKVAEEVNQDECQKRRIPVIRRISGGSTILTARGCLMYALVLSLEKRPELKAVDHIHCCVLDRMAEALSNLMPGVRREGISDLTLEGKKFSGNSIRIRRRCLLYHGTLLYNFPLDLAAQCLAAPGRQPEYRAGRGHLEFLTNFPAEAEKIRQTLIHAWGAIQHYDNWPWQRVGRLVAEKYSRPDWNNRR